MGSLGEKLEKRQIGIYFATVAAAIAAARLPGAEALQGMVNAALALMLFATFLQIPLAALGSAFSKLRFLAVLVVANFIAVPVLVAVLLQWLPAGDTIVRLGVLLVLLTPCIDYVVTFSHLGRSAPGLLLAATPLLLILQMLLLPVYFALFLGRDATGLLQPEPFVQAFVWLIAPCRSCRSSWSRRRSSSCCGPRARRPARAPARCS